MKCCDPNHWRRSLLLLGGCWGCLVWAATGAEGAAPRATPPGQPPADQRLGELKDLNGYFPFEPPASREQWASRAESLKRRVLVAAGLWPMPEKTPLHSVIHGRAEREDFTVEKVYFESLPGHFVTGLLFRPKGKPGRLPGVLCPHGHGGRLQDYGAEGIRQQIVQGAERFEGSGRYPKLARCAQLARMGCVAFIFDMEGYADSVQIPRAIAHGFREQRPEMDQPDRWGFFSTQAELRMQSILGLHMWNCIRALDLLCELPDVDPQRIGVTGGSGGGTQTILLGAIDPRPIVAFPQGMVSTAMQGGCTCENACCLRVDGGNVELAALFAPKPLAMTAANDWTIEMMTKGYPQLQQLYGMLGAENQVLCVSQTQFHHNYNYVSRAVMYQWFNKPLQLGLAEPIVEEDWQPLSEQEYTVWDDQHPPPEGGPDHEVSLTRYLDQQSRRQMAALAPTDDASLSKYREVVGGALATLIGRALPDAADLESGPFQETQLGQYVALTGLLRQPRYGEQLPVVVLRSRQAQWNEQVVVWVSGRGKDALFTEQGAPLPEIRRLLDAGAGVVGADLLGQGEFQPDGLPLAQNRVVDNPREFAGYTFGYNHPLLAQRVHDILTLITMAWHKGPQPNRVDLAGVQGAGPWVAAARAMAGKAVTRAVVDTEGFRFQKLTSYRDVNFLPGAVKYGDLPGMLSLSAPYPLWLAGESGRTPEAVAAAYRAAGAENHVASHQGNAETVAAAAVDWLLAD